MDSSLLNFLSGAGQFLLVAAIAFVLYCLLVSHLRFELLADRAAQGDIPALQAAQGAAAVVASRIATSSRPFALLLFRAGGLDDDAPPEAELRRLEQAARAEVRRGDRVALADAGSLLALVEAPGTHAPVILQRIRQALAAVKVTRAEGLQRPVEVRGAVARYPADRTRATELIDLARARLARSEPTAAAAEPAAAQAPADGQSPRLLDPLTGVLRTDLLFTSVQKYLARRREAEQPFSLLYADVDHMRRYNDQYGKSRGDRILRAVSGYLQRSVREGDLIGRGEGGDEFAVAMPADGATALAVARRLVLALRRADKEAQMDGLRVGLSIGVAHWPEHGATARHVLESARIAVRQAKNRGRGVAAMADGPAPAETMVDTPRDRL